MNLNDISPIFSIISSICVVISLIFLAIQIRGSIKATKGETYQNMINSWNEYLLFLLENDILLNLRQKAMYNFQELNTDEKEMFYRLFEYELGFHENMLFQKRKGYIENKVHLGWENGFKAWINRPGPRTCWEMHDKKNWSSDLQKFITHSLVKGNDCDQ